MDLQLTQPDQDWTQLHVNCLKAILLLDEADMVLYFIKSSQMELFFTLNMILF